MRLIIAAILSVFSIHSSAEAKLAVILSAHQEALSIVKSNPLPPPIVAWGFAKANIAANTAYAESGRSDISYEAAFLETWALLMGISNPAQIRMTKDSESEVLFGLEVARREWKKSEEELKAAKDKSWRSPDFSKIGRWQLTPPAFDQPLLPNWARMSLFGSNSTAALTRGLLPPTWNSPEAVRDLLEVIRLGSTNSKDRTSEQSVVASFWAAGPKTVTPPGMWIEIALSVITQEKVSEEIARQIMQAISMAMADAGTACWNLKFETLVWRPVTAAQEYLKGKDWAPFINTPPFPSYVSGHSSFSGAAATVLSAMLGDNKSFNVKSDAHPGLERSFRSFTAAAREAGQSRIYGGIHFQADNRDGLELGRRSACSILSDLGLGSCDAEL